MFQLLENERQKHDVTNGLLQDSRAKVNYILNENTSRRDFRHSLKETVQIDDVIFLYISMLKVVIMITFGFIDQNGVFGIK